jgi:hypothetical protein
MKEPKRYYCGNGEGMFEDNKNGHWVEYSEHKAIVEALTEQLRKHAVSGRSEQLCPSCKVPMKPLYDKMACFKCMTHTP